MNDGPQMFDICTGTHGSALSPISSATEDSQKIPLPKEHMGASCGRLGDVHKYINCCYDHLCIYVRPHQSRVPISHAEYHTPESFTLIMKDLINSGEYNVLSESPPPADKSIEGT